MPEENKKEKRNTPARTGNRKPANTNQKKDTFIPHMIQDNTPAAENTAKTKTQSFKARSQALQGQSAANATASEAKKPESRRPRAQANPARPEASASARPRAPRNAPPVAPESAKKASRGQSGESAPSKNSSGRTGSNSRARVKAPTWANESKPRGRNAATDTPTAPATTPVLSPQYALATSRGGARNFRGTNIRSAAPKMQENTRNLSSDTLKIIPLGGLCEIGKNMTVYQYGNDMILVDVGVLFPEESQPGIDAVIPDFSYVLEHIDNLRAIFITHGHEDHIGSLPYLMKSIRKNVPIYGGKLAAELIKLKFEDRGMKQFSQQVYSVLPGQTRRAGCFDVEFINVNHSIADAFSLAITSPAGIAVHSGDFKIDYTPVNGTPIDLPRFAELGSKGVLVYVGESTNVSQPGFTMSEKTVGETFARQFESATGRVFVATFSSNVSRVQQIITAAEKSGRKVALVGRSMLNVFNAANKLGYIKMKEDTLVELDQINRLKPEEVCVISTGSQGEPMSALTRMAYAEHRSVEIRGGDTVIISATPIPGNEKPIYRVIDELYKRGANVVYSSIAAIHVSGHANLEEHKIMHELLRPKYFVPAHGEYRMLYHHGQLAHELGMAWDNIFILNNGDIFECDQASARIGGYTTAEAILIDGESATLKDSVVLQQRKDLTSDGVISVAVCLNKQYQLHGQPEILSYGALMDSDESAANNEIARFVSQFIQKSSAEGSKLPSILRSRQFRGQLQNFFYSRAGRRPVTLVSVFEV
ncbi:MAG: RNase J family beta-CASP ribonuclease [Clostridia bacterium]|nr:RNase J family beta-CASP ribonuclease [Clostridia bacterium]